VEAASHGILGGRRKRTMKRVVLFAVLRRREQDVLIRVPLLFFSFLGAVSLSLESLHNSQVHSINSPQQTDHFLQI
jgi:hypothetical protein